jgi:signal transduction histidine kinase
VQLRDQIGQVIEEESVVLGFRPSLSLEGPVDSKVPDVAQPHLLAVLREALSNAARHAKATAVGVSLSAGSEVVLTVTDDGRGIDEGVTTSGIHNMRQRAEELGGVCEVARRPEGGTRVTWAVPLA